MNQMNFVIWDPYSTISHVYTYIPKSTTLVPSISDKNTCFLGITLIGNMEQINFNFSYLKRPEGFCFGV
jgi:hypothetical protein